MPIPKIRFRCLTQIFSPVSGQPADGEDLDGPNENDPTLLFVHYGNACMYAYVSTRLQDHLKNDVESMEIDSLHEAINIEGGIVLEVDTDRNGINCYGFAPEIDIES